MLSFKPDQAIELLGNKSPLNIYMQFILKVLIDMLQICLTFPKYGLGNVAAAMGPQGFWSVWEKSNQSWLCSVRCETYFCIRAGKSPRSKNHSDPDKKRDRISYRGQQEEITYLK